MFNIVNNDKNHHPSCHENLSVAFHSYGVSPDAIATSFNIFMNVEVSSDGKVKIQKPKSKPGDYIVFKAAMDLIVGLTACSHEETNNHNFGPIGYEIL